MNLFPYQSAASAIVAASKLAKYNVFDPGLGKSCTAIDVAKKINARRVLITGPMTATYSWRLELKKFWPNHPPFKIIRSSNDVSDGEGVFYVTYGLLSRSASVTGLLRVGAAFDLSVLDESHALKNPSAARTKAVLSSKTGFRDRLGLAHPMSATPAPNHAGELWPVLASLRPDLITENGKRMSKSAFGPFAAPTAPANVVVPLLSVVRAKLPSTVPPKEMAPVPVAMLTSAASVVALSRRGHLEVAVGGGVVGAVEGDAVVAVGFPPGGRHAQEGDAAAAVRRQAGEGLAEADRGAERGGAAGVDRQRDRRRGGSRSAAKQTTHFSSVSPSPLRPSRFSRHSRIH